MARREGISPGLLLMFPNCPCRGAGTKQWFAGASYNAALMAMNSKDASAAAEIFRACGIFHEAQPFTTPEYWKIRRVCASIIPNVSSVKHGLQHSGR